MASSGPYSTYTSAPVRPVKTETTPLRGKVRDSTGCCGDVCDMAAFEYRADVKDLELDGRHWRELFGGAITVDLPTRLVDVSDFRPVPDNQEVWTDADRDESIIVELLERVDVGPSDAEGAAAWFFRDLAAVNDASVESGLSRISRTTVMTGDEHLPSLNGPFAHASMCVGTQTVAKGRDGDDARNDVEVVVVNVRLPQVRTDVLVTLNRTTRVAPGSSADAPRAGEEIESAAATATRVAATLRIRDWNLFG